MGSGVSELSDIPQWLWGGRYFVLYILTLERERGTERGIQQYPGKRGDISCSEDAVVKCMGGERWAFELVYERIMCERPMYAQMCIVQRLIKTIYLHLKTLPAGQPKFQVSMMIYLHNQ
jgi:hypothetical protein